MSEFHSRLFALCMLFFVLVLLACPLEVDAHAALERSEPAAGASLTTPPDEIRLWFTEPLEQTYSGAELLEASGEPVAGVSARISPDDAHHLVLDLPDGLADGNYTVAWRTLSSADGHTLDGYFGFHVGTGPAGATAGAGLDLEEDERLRPLSRGIALVGLAALLAIAPLTLGLFDPITRSRPGLVANISRGLRRYAVLASGLAVLGSLFALWAQARAIVPDASAGSAIVQALSETRYGQLWLLRLALLLASIVLVAVSLERNGSSRRRLLAVATLVSLALPLPFSLLSHASAQTVGRASAVASDAIHLLFASLWAGGLFMLALVLVPAIWSAEPAVRSAGLYMAFIRFSVLGVASWIILLLSGLYAAWIQVGDLAALTETEYGQTLLLKGLLLIPVLLLAAFHFILGWRGAPAFAGSRPSRTVIVEACIVVAVLLVVGRLIGLEPAREVMANREPAEMRLALTFPADGQQQNGWLVISPGVAGNNTFTVQIDGATLPEGSEAVLRFALPDRNIGEQELRLSAIEPNTFRAVGSEISLVGDWQVTAIVRKIGEFSWRTELTVPVGNQPPASPVTNPAPHFGPVGAVGMVAIATGIAGLAVAVLARGAAAVRRVLVATVAGILLIAGSIGLGAARTPAGTGIPTSAPAATTEAVATPAASFASPAVDAHNAHMAQATPEPAPETEPVAPAAGTPVTNDGLTVTLEVKQPEPGPVDIMVVVESDDAAISGARVAVLSEMAGMEGQELTTAEETAPGRYLASGVPLSMSGEWRLAVRISPRGESTRIVTFGVNVP